ncbi:hypothetical protein SHI21_07910 [Bacteriovorax sp. PP10]|uniref:Uncharacterized protein n=1 Tax=Bacteriovorax antarcticus TaxID=3088717 RepID=A0ABU5VST8_9BACT|nr:hypothetical protein [Bacteriovorax sp. PP10]MEA9356121.1 hypothetical protein [Bacteriovorax sp. PP10]
MKKILFAVFSLAIATSSFASVECNKKAFAAAKAVDAISNNSKKSTYTLVSTETINSVEAGGEALDTIEVRMTVGEDSSAVWHVDLFNTACVIKNVRYVTGD